MQHRRPRIVYVSYDGAGEPLGRSQVLAYLVRLARSCDITLISFEKDRASRPETAQLLQKAGIAWLPRSYHRRPPVLSTLWDTLLGACTVRKACREADPDIVHTRGYVPALIALVAEWPRRRRWRLLFDIRGFWADERVLAGAWTERSLLFRVAKRCERRFFAETDAVVTLTEASVPQIRTWLGVRQAPVRVIPTCADVERFGDAQPLGDGPRAVWCGSIGTVYRFDLAVRFVDALKLPFLVLTRQADAARAQLGNREADIREVAHEDIASELRPGDIGLCFYADGHLGNLGRAPTRIAEYLAAGMVTAITPGVGDLDTIVDRHGLGVRIEDESETGLALAAAKALALVADPDVRARGPRLAAELYSVDDGAVAYLELYRQLQRSATNSAAEAK
jgi:glycosyltransferase involved in cell wall biosynthesis